MNQNLNRTALIPTLCYDIGNTDILCKGGRTRCPGHIFHIPFQSLMWDKYIDRCRDHKYVQVAHKGSILCVKKQMFIKICRSPIFERVFGLLVQPFGENPQNPGKHWSQVIPVMPGLQRHCPLTSSQSSSYAPIGSQAHSLLQPTPELMFQ